MDYSRNDYAIRRTSIEQILEWAEKDEKPNFTQFQLKLMALNAGSQDYDRLCTVMEKKFKLASLEERLISVSEQVKIQNGIQKEMQ